MGKPVPVAAAAAVLALLPVGCGSSHRATQTNDVSAPKQQSVSEQPSLAAPVRFVATPSGSLQLCRRLSLLRSVCPSHVPARKYRSATRPPGWRGATSGAAIASCDPHQGSLTAGNCDPGPDEWVLQAGAPAGLPSCPGEAPPGLTGKRLGPSRTRPPGFVHLDVYATRGSLDNVFSFEWPRSPTHRISDRLLTCRRPHPTDLGRFRWAGHEGTLVLAPAYPGGGQDGDHLIYRWKHRGIDYAISLHSWAPLRQAVSVLRQIVESAGTH